jgi:ABC-type multidrug transport system fused ATPase/permease subunit
MIYFEMSPRIFKLTDLQDQVVKLLIQKKLLTTLIMVNIMGVVIDLVSSWTLFQISIGNLGFVYAYVGLDVLNTILETTYIRSTNDRIANSIRYDFKLNAIRQYNKLSFDSKNKATAESFYQKMLQLADSYFQLINWGIPNIFQLIGSFFKCFVIFCFKGMFYPLILIIGINLIVYVYSIKHKQKAFSDSIKLTRENNDMIRSLVSITLPMFQQGEKPPEYIMGLTTKIDNAWLNVDNQWNNIMTMTKLINKSGIIIIGMGFADSVSGFLLLVNTLGNLNGSISSLTAFMNHNNRYETNYESYVKFFKKLEYRNAPIRLTLPESFTIQSVNIHHGGFHMTFDPSIMSLNITKSDKILIRGRTGHGKSTFINALMGKIQGIQLDKGSPENYFGSYVEMYQNIREKLPTSSICIRKLFDDEPSDELIYKCLEPCFPDDDLKRIFSNLIKSHIDKLKSDETTNDINSDNSDNSAKDSDDNFVDIEAEIDEKEILMSKLKQHSNINPLDIDIAERISGGEKTRLALATRIHQMLSKSDKQILILDEPEQGSDPEVAIKVIGEIFKLFNDRTIIMISHICECQLNVLNINWTHKLKVHNGIISKMN